MIFVPNENNDPRVNLAIETYLLTEMPLDEPFFYFTLTSRQSLLAVTKIQLKKLTKNM